MHIAGFQKNSLIDFPGQIAAVVFTPGCNFVCPYCHNPDLAAGKISEESYTQEEILTFLEKRKGLIQGLAITGGEPTLQKDLEDFIKTVRKMGYKIKLDSNGTRPDILSRLLEQNLVDYLAMDIKSDLDHYPLVMKNKKEMDKIIQSIDLIMEQAPAYEFRTTCARPFISKEIMKHIGEMIRNAQLYVLQNCSQNVEILDPGFKDERRHFFTESEMDELKAVITPYVKEVRLR